MNLVAIYDLPDERESLGAPLAQALEKTLYEANARLRSPGPGPLVVAVLGELNSASTLKAKLDAAGLKAVTVTDEEVKPLSSRLSVKGASFDENALKVETRQSKTVEIPYARVRLLLHAMGSQRETTTETIKESKFDVGMAVMSGGLKLSKTTESTVEHVEESREPFLLMLAPGNPVLEFRESRLSYEFLGPAKQPSRAVNFNTLVTMLRERCQGAVYDNRLLQKPEQIKLLGPLLNPEAYLDTALTVLAKVLWVSA